MGSQWPECQHYYIEILTKLHGVKRKQPGLWGNGWILHQNKVPPYSALSVKQFVANKHINVFAHPLIYLILRPATSSLFHISNPHTKELVVLVNEVKAKTTDLLNRLTENVLHHCLE